MQPTRVIELRDACTTARVPRAVVQTALADIRELSTTESARPVDDSVHIATRRYRGTAEEERTTSCQGWTSPESRVGWLGVERDSKMTDKRSITGGYVDATDRNPAMGRSKVMLGQGTVPDSLVGDDDLVPCLAVEPPVSPKAGACPGGSPTTAAIAAAGWVGMVLDPVQLSGRLVVPVVEILPAGWDRILAGLGPELDRSTLAMWESWRASMGASPPRRPVRIVGFVAEGSWRRAVVTAAWLAGYGPSLIVRRSVPSAVHRSEADYLGITVAVVGKDLSAAVVVRGRLGPVPSAGRTVAVRQREEFLFAAAISQGRLSSRLSACSG